MPPASPEGRGPTWPLVALLLLGAALFAARPDAAWQRPYILAAALAAVALIPAVNRRLTAALEILRAASLRRPWLPAAILFVGSVAYLGISAVLFADRRLLPTYHDEYMYQLQAQILARGRLWLPPHPIGEFFDAFFVLTRPVYASTYFPGTALLYVPGVWLGLEAWYTSILIAGAIVALAYLVIAELLDPLAGYVAALLAISLEQLRVLSVMTMSHTVLLLLFLATTWAYLRWRATRRTGWAVAVGALAGWAAITRPLDAACLILPLGLCLLWDLRATDRGRVAKILGLAILAALPFLLLQLVFDKGVTGRWTRPPISEYNLQNFPGSAGPKPADVATAESPSHLPQVRDYYREFVRPRLVEPTPGGFLRTWLGGRLAAMADAALPYRILYLLVPVGLLALRASPVRQAIAVGLLLMPIAYAFWPFFLLHYALAVAPAFILLTLLGIDVLRRRWPAAGTPLLVGVAALAIGALPQVSGRRDRAVEAQILDLIDFQLAQLDRRPAVVLFRYESGTTTPHFEPVYNVTTAWPDDAPLVRAHDLGPEANRRIYDYYAKLGPDWYFYHYDRATGELKPLGLAKDLAAAPR